MKKVLLWIWQLPQNIVAILYWLVFWFSLSYKGKIVDINILCWNKRSGMSLGNFIFIPEDASDNKIKHELNHTRQSKILGPLYLVIIGLPSLLHNIIYRIFKKTKYRWNYYKFYTEHWMFK